MARLIEFYDVYKHCRFSVHPDDIREVRNESTIHGGHSLIRLIDGQSRWVSENYTEVIKRRDDALRDDAH